jgi:hypothetical protein
VKHVPGKQAAGNEQSPDRATIGSFLFQFRRFTEDGMLKWVPRCDSLPEGPSQIDKLLRARGFEDPAVAQAFLHPSRDQLGDPFQMPGMREAADRIVRAREIGRAVVVYGDYDVDGVTATALLTGFLEAFGVHTRHYIPSRHREGYGLNEAAIRRIASDGDGALMITVDCGITAVAEIALAKEFGLDPIVTTTTARARRSQTAWCSTHCWVTPIPTFAARAWHSSCARRWTATWPSSSSTSRRWVRWPTWCR